MSSYLEHHWLETPVEVWTIIHAAHGKDLVVFSSFSDPEHGRMETAYGFKDADAPLLRAETTWDTPINKETCKRENEVHKHWICIVVLDSDDDDD